MSHHIRSRLRKLEAKAPPEPRPNYEIAVLTGGKELDRSAYPEDATIIIIRSQGKMPTVE
ncbi:MAG: hypothetical protein FKY71_20045 [Spiribacter salinus]|uniref:Uncharacterized protein n=1 Tax=Spiribacter salinus TaxID=1335746 RepID=A0A540V557_9GAMM|nr:MAG: hypothetical protein FKY71_20045 [Spiribacter salinus]